MSFRIYAEANDTQLASTKIMAVYLSSDGHSLVLTVSYQNNWPPPVYPGCRKTAWKSEKIRARGNDVI